MLKKVVLITGTSSGIGLHASISLARAGHTVIATMRNLAKRGALDTAARAANVELDVAPLDITDPDSVRSAVSDAASRHARIDVLVNNAGVAHVGTLESLSDRALRDCFESNFFGVARVTREVLPLMRAAGRGHIVAVTSVGGVVGQPFNDAYCAAKFACEGLFESLAPVARRDGIAVSIVEPGGVVTDFIANAGATLSAASQGPHAQKFKEYVEKVTSAMTTAQSGEEVGAFIARVVGEDSPRLRYQTSAWAERFVGTKLRDTSGELVAELIADRYFPPASPP